MPSLAGSEGEFGAEALQDLDPLGARALGHAEPHRVPFGCADHGDGDAGVAGRRLEDGLARREVAALLGPGDHAERRPVLDGPARVAPLQLAENVDARLGARVHELDEGRAPDGLQQVHDSGPPV